ncbi:putative 40S ribosomal protein S14 mitochondrial, partial [Trichostrongylus colubriformis]
MLRVLSGTHRLFQSVWKRALATVPPVEAQVVSEEKADLEVGEVESLETSEPVAAVKETYSREAIARLKLDQYPFYVEREWWKKGKRMTFWATWRQLRDVKRREHLAEIGAYRRQLKAIKWNTILPQAIRDDAAEELFTMPKTAHPKRILNMCMFTARQRGKIKPYRLNRHLFRKLADHSKL